jgi:UDP-N-acetyl-D-galactosamine dehydrogenase
MLGLSFKENCPDLRNTRVVDLIRGLREFGLVVDVHDPWVKAEDARNECGLQLLSALPAPGGYHAVVLAVAHDQYKTLGVREVRALTVPSGVIYDINGLFGKDAVEGRL